MTTDDKSHVDTTVSERAQRIVTHLRGEAFTRGFTQGQLADAAGVTRVTMNNYLTGKTSMPIEVFLKVCEVLGLDPYKVIDL